MYFIIMITTYIVVYLRNCLRFHKYKHKSRTTIDSYPIIDKLLPIDTTHKKYRLHFTGTGLLLPYQLGFIKRFLENHDSENIRKYCHISGVSGGAASAGFMYATIYGVGNIEYWYKYNVRQISEILENQSVPILSLHNLSDLIWDLSYDTYRICNYAGFTSEYWNNAYSIYITNNHKQERAIINNSTSFADAMTSSSFIPLLFSGHLYSYCNNNYTIDGGFYSVAYPPDDKITINFDISYNSEKVVINPNGNYTVYIGQPTWTPSNIATYQQYLACYSSRADELFHLGYNIDIKLPFLSDIKV